MAARTDPASPRPRLGTFSALGNRNFRLMWTGLLLSNTGTWMQTVSQGWLVYQLTDSAVYLGAVGLVRAVPLLTLSLFGGAIADRIDRRRLLYLTNLSAALLALALAILTFTGVVQVWHILLLAFLSSAVLSFDQPARQALIPALVPKELLLNAISLNSMTFNGAAIVGPALAGALVPVIGLAGNFLLNALSFGFVPLSLWRMDLPPWQAAAPGHRSLAADLRAGLRYVRVRPALLALLMSAAGMSFCARSYIALLPVFARDILGVGVEGLGWMMAAPGLGTVAGAFLLASVHDFRRKGLLVLTASLALSLSLTAFANTRAFPLALAFLGLGGAAAILMSSTINTLLQLAVDDSMRGRVMSMYTLTMLGMLPLGQMPLGAASSLWGAPMAVAVGAMGSAAVTVAAFRRVPGLLQVE